MKNLWKYSLGLGILFMFWSNSPALDYMLVPIVAVVAVLLFGYGIFGLIRYRNQKAEASRSSDNQMKESPSSEMNAAEKAELARMRTELAEMKAELAKMKHDAPAYDTVSAARRDLEARETARKAREAEKQARRAGTHAEEYSVAGVSYRQDVFERVGDENPCYSLSKKQFIEENGFDNDVPKYYFDGCDVSIELDPENKYDPHAVKVLLNDQLVGYIPAEDSEHVSEIMNEELLVDMDAKIVGGPQRRYDSFDDRIEDIDLMFGIRITLYVKKKPSEE